MQVAFLNVLQSQKLAMNLYKSLATIAINSPELLEEIKDSVMEYIEDEDFAEKLDKIIDTIPEFPVMEEHIN